jgi:SpoVK/Ycf46/Vps4 family AAA+-type ATPase
MEKFVGASEANLRAVFDNPPDVYKELQSTDEQYSALNRAALHVIVLDEFDAMARARGGKGGGGDSQGDAGVARDSVVNQLLAKMDGVDELVVPTLVVGMTNKRSLIEPALLRPGRFEVQIEVPPPKTVAQRISILKVHTQQMFLAGRLLVKDAPPHTAAARRLDHDHFDSETLVTYDQLLQHLAIESPEYSGAMLAGVARAAASHALERAVCDFAGTSLETDGNDVNVNGGETSKVVNGSSPSSSQPYGTTIADCLVTLEDLELAIADVRDSNPAFSSSKEEDNKSGTHES